MPGAGRAALAAALRSFADGKSSAAMRDLETSLSAARTMPDDGTGERARLLQAAHFLQALLVGPSGGDAFVGAVDAGVASVPASPLGLRLAADLYRAAGRQDLADATEDRLLRVWPDDDRLLCRMLGRIAAGDTEGAAADARWWLKLSSNPPPDDLAWALAALVDDRTDLAPILGESTSRYAAEYAKGVARLEGARTHKRTFGDLMNGGGITRKDAVAWAERDLGEASRRYARFAALHAVALLRAGRADEARAVLEAAQAALPGDGFVTAAAASLAPPAGERFVSRLGPRAAERLAELGKKVAYDGRQPKPLDAKARLRAVLRLAEAAIDGPMGAEAMPARAAAFVQSTGRFTASVETPGPASSAAVEAELLARVASLAKAAGASHMIVVAREDAYFRGTNQVPNGVGLLVLGAVAAFGGLDPDDPIEVDEADPWRVSTADDRARDQGRRKRAVMSFMLTDGPSPGAIPVADLGTPSRATLEVRVRN